MDSKLKIYKLLTEHLDTIEVKVIDESYKHANHKKDTQGGHFKALIISNSFQKMALIDRHKLVYNILEKMMKVEIHALSMQTLTEEEYNQ